jgi:AraC family transcriptional regulator
LTPALLRSAAEGIGLDPDRATLAPRFQLKDPRIEHIGWALKAELESGYPSDRLYAESLGMALAAHLLRHYAPSRLLPKRGHGLSKRQLRRVIDHIEEHLDQSLSLADLAAAAGVSASHFKVLFKQSLGVPAHQYVVQRRVERAKVLLLQGRLAMSQVALEAGFAHQSHMARCMRRVLGVTPTDVVRNRD